MENESKLFTVLKWVLGLSIAWLSSFFVLNVIKGIIGLGICVILGVAAVEFWPLLQLAIKGAAINVAKLWARRDPIGAAQSVEMSKTEELQKYREETTSIDSDTRTFARLVEQTEREYPDDPETKRLQEQLQMLRDTVSDRRQTEVDFELALENYRAGIRKMQVMWSASQAGEKASKRANMSKRQYERLIAETSFDTVQKAMDTMSARLAESRAAAEAKRAVAALPPRAVHPTLVTTPAKAPVARRS
jgi:hypothetical protein